MVNIRVDTLKLHITAQTEVTSGARDLIWGLNLYLQLYFVYVSIKGSGKSESIRRFSAIVFYLPLHNFCEK